MWLVEALERLPPTLIGKRIIDSIPYGSRLSASLSHLTVEQITAPDGYKEIIRLIEEQHEYLKIAKLEQAFTEAIFKGRRRQGQTISGFLATKKAGFAELKKQGLDLLATEAGEHLLGHLVLRQGGFSADQQQRIRVLTDGSIQFKKIEEAIRKIFGDAVDEAPAGRVYWGGGDDEWDPDGYPDDSLYDQTFGAHYQNEGQLHQDYGYYGSGEMEAETYLAHPGGEDVFTDLLEMDEATSEVYVCLQEPLPQMLDEAEAVEHAGELMNYVYGETAERWASKGKGKGKRPKGKGKGKSKDGVPIKGTGKNSKGFGIYGTGTYADHRRALQEARTNRGFSGSRGEFQRPRTSLQDLKNRSRCHQCQQIGHWSRDCPQRRRAPSLASSRPTSPGPGAAGRGPSGPSANMFFMSEPGPSGDDDQGMFWSQELEPGMPVYATFVDEKLPEAVLQPDRETFSAASAYMSEAIVESSALIDTAAQHGLIGEETLQKHDQLLQRLFQLRVQVTNEDGGVVRGVCGAEQITKIAYIPIGLGSKAGVLKVQVVVGHVPCLLPAYLLTKLGAVIDMCNLLAVYTEANTFQFMKRRLSGHVEVNICEFGKRWCVPETYTFLKSEVWDQGPLPTPLSELRVTVLNGSGQTLPMPSSMAPLCSAIVVFLLQSGQQHAGAGAFATSSSRTSPLGCSTRSSRTTGIAAAAAGGSALGRSRQPALPTSQSTGGGGQGLGTTTSCRTCGAEQVSDSCAQAYCQLPAQLPEAWGQCRVELGEMPDMRGDRANTQDGNFQDERVELHHDLPATRLQDTACQEGRESRESRSEESPWNTGATTFDDDELQGAYASPPEHAPDGSHDRAPGHRHTELGGLPQFGRRAGLG